MPISPEQLEKRLIIAAKARREIRKTTLALMKTGKIIIKKHNARNKKSSDNE